MKQTQQAEKPRAHPAWLIIISLSIPMFMASLDNLVVTNALQSFGQIWEPHWKNSPGQ